MKKVKAVVFLFLASLLLLGNCDENSQCSKCFAREKFVKYCLQSRDSQEGLCCDSDSTGVCSQQQNFCSNSIKNYRLDKVRYAFCAYNPRKCGALGRTLMARNTAQSVYTTLEFTSDDVCPYTILSDAQLHFNTRVQITADAIYNAELHLLTGQSIDSLTSQRRISVSSTVEVNTDLFASLLVIPTAENPFVKFTYQSKPILDRAGWISVIVVGIFVYVVLVLAAVGVLMRVMFNYRLSFIDPPQIEEIRKEIEYKKVLAAEEALQLDNSQGPKQQDFMNGSYGEQAYQQNNDDMGRGHNIFNPPAAPAIQNQNDNQDKNNFERVATAQDSYQDNRNIERYPSNQNASQFSNPQQRGGGERPKVQIKPYKLTFE